ncbi:MAG: AAA family ATPase [Rhodanobacteraceae bacterium]|nr:MAG: AAA family ATPase [Rhodanobacteraceae bacterium]
MNPTPLSAAVNHALHETPPTIRRMDEQADRDLLMLDRIADKHEGGEHPPISEGSRALDAHVVLVNAASVESKPVRWLWPGWIARGKLHVIAGAPGTGKTTAALAWAACITACRPFPSGWKPTTPGRVLIWSGEDDIADTLKPRLIAAGADLSRVQFVQGVEDHGEQYAFNPARDVPMLAAELAGVDDVRMIVIDPLVSAVSGDSHKNAEVRRSLAPLVDLAQRMDSALIGITHYSKGTQGREPLERVSGSLAFGALARLVFGTVKQKGDDDTAPTKYLLARVKSNIGPDGGGFAYTFEQTDIGGGIIASRTTWGGEVQGSARELLAEAEAEPDDAGQDAVTFLRDLLASGALPTKEVFREAEGAGYSRDQVKRAKAKIGAIAEKQGMTGGWSWRLSATEGSRHVTEGSEGSEQNYPRSSHPSGEESHPSGTANGVEAFDL